MRESVRVGSSPLLVAGASAAPRSHRRLLERLRARLIGVETRCFEIELPGGMVHLLGRPAPAAGEGPGAIATAPFRIRIQNETGVRAFASFDEAQTAAALVRGDIEIEGDFLAALGLRRLFSDSHPVWSLGRFLSPLLRGQSESDKRWIPRHYDHGDEFYFAFLDRDVRLYSQALYRSPDDTLEQAARCKLDYILETCRLTEGSDVLDVGAGWGSFSRHAAERGINVTMMTLARRQYEHLGAMARAAGTPGRLEVFCESIYRFAPGRRYDAIVLLGVMEHLPDYAGLFKQLDLLLKPNGRVYMDFSAVREKYNISSFTYRHVFPGNHSPVVLPELLAAANRSPFELIAVHNDRHSYFLTLCAWARNLEAAHDRLVREFGHDTFRVFQLYLWATAHALGVDGALESYRVIVQKSMGVPSREVGLS